MCPGHKENKRKAGGNFIAGHGNGITRKIMNFYAINEVFLNKGVKSGKTFHQLHFTLIVTFSQISNLPKMQTDA